VHDHVRHLAAADVAVDLYTETPLDPRRREAAEEAFPDGIAVHWIDGGGIPVGRKKGTIVIDRITNYPRWARRVAGLLRPGAEVVHAHGLAGLGVADLRRRRELAAPLVLVTHGMEEFAAPPLKRLAYRPFRAGMRRIGAAADRIVVTDEVLVPVVRKSLHIGDERLVVIPNAIDPQQCVDAADEARADALLQGAGMCAAPLFVSVGRLAPNKGFDHLARALARAAGDLPTDWGWVLIGDGHERARIQRVVESSGISDRVVFAGAVDDRLKHGLMARADWFVHPTLYEGSSLVTLEAMAHALPVIASRAGGLPDKVIEGETGWLVTPGDEAELAAAISRAPRTDGAAMGRAGQRLLVRRFSWAAATERYLELYRGLLAGG
jgi:glycosyltransferase involved in cell wall biosynthesis